MRSILVAVALGASALCGPASAQLGADSEMMRLVAQLQSESSVQRQRAIRDLERNPGNYAPLLYFLVVPELVSLGRSEDALRWKYFAQVRLVADVRLMLQNNPVVEGTTAEGMYDQFVDGLLTQMPVVEVSDVSPARRRVLLNEAIQLDGRAPRLYALNYMFGGAGTAAWPSRQSISVARFAAANAARAGLEREIERAEVLAAMDAEIASGGVAAEAATLIPEAFRDRVRPVRSVRFDDPCGSPFFVGTPAGAQPEAFVVSCSAADTFPPRRSGQTENKIRWLAADTLAQISETRAPQPSWGGEVAVRGGSPHAMFQSTDGTTLSTLLLAPDGSVSVITNSGGHHLMGSLSPSGRYALRHINGGFEVIDLETNTLVHRRERNADAAQNNHRFNFLAEPGDGQLLVVGYEFSIAQPSATGADFVSLDVRTGRSRRMTIENAQRFSAPMPWGSSQAMVTLQRPDPPATTPSTVETYRSVEEFEAARQRTQQGPREVVTETQTVGIIDLLTMQMEWTGPQSEAPPPRAGYRCGGASRPGRIRPTRVMGFFGPELRHAANTVAGAFVLETPARGAATGCAITGDGEHLVVVAPPFVHHYAIAAN